MKGIGFVLALALEMACGPALRGTDVGARRVGRRPQVDQLAKCIDTWKDMLTLQRVVESYSMDHKFYPKTQAIEDLRALLEPVYVEAMPTQDAWGTAYRYVASSDGRRYWIVSAGSDRAFEERTWATPAFLSDSARDAVRTSDGWKADREWVIQP
jgi:hypothetical protein